MELMSLVSIVGGVIALIITFVIVKNILDLRVVVKTNEVHIIQSSAKRTSYGSDKGNGNTYYEWPSWMPFIGISKTVLPLSIMPLEIASYEAYDKNKLPFMVKINAFYRIKDSDLAAERISSMDDLREQLMDIIRNVSKSILAEQELIVIMESRSLFGDKFTTEVEKSFTELGVVSTSNIEFTNIEDVSGSNVIKNIMEKKKSHIQMESRIEVAKNMQAAEQAEIDAQRSVDVNKQDAIEQVGIRTAEAKRKVDLADQESLQLVKEQEKITKEKEMEVVRMANMRAAEINKDVLLVKAGQDKATALIKAAQESEVAIIKVNQEKETIKIKAEVDKEAVILFSQAKLTETENRAKGISAEGTAVAEAEKAKLMAPVHADIERAEKIGQNKEYQQFLITIEQVKATRDIGIEQAKALQSANVNLVANAESPSAAVNNVMDLFSGKGGSAIGTMLQGFANTEAGKKVLETVGITTDNK